MINIPIEKTKASKLENIDFNDIPFGRTFSDHMFITEFEDGEWKNPRIVPYGPIGFDPACLALHYGQSIFEGMKASMMVNGQPALYRPDKSIERLNRSAERMCMPTLPEEMFYSALHALVDLDKGWIPPAKGSALYIRPLLFASDEFIGVRPSEKYTFIIMTGPVGPYYPKPVSLITADYYVRAVRGGVGEAKTAGNYAASLLAMREANQKGYDQILWMDAMEYKYIQEVGTMNIFFVIDDKVITPATDGAILKGITRDSFLTMLKAKGMTVEERPVTIDEIVAAYQAGKLQEVFGAGTAAVVSKVKSISHNGLDMELNVTETPVGNWLKTQIDGLRSGEVKDEHNWIVPIKSSVLV